MDKLDIYYNRPRDWNTEITLKEFGINDIQVFKSKDGITITGVSSEILYSLQFLLEQFEMKVVLVEGYGPKNMVVQLELYFRTEKNESK